MSIETSLCTAWNCSSFPSQPVEVLCREAERCAPACRHLVVRPRRLRPSRRARARPRPRSRGSGCPAAARAFRCKTCVENWSVVRGGTGGYLKGKLCSLLLAARSWHPRRLVAVILHWNSLSFTAHLMFIRKHQAMTDFPRQSEGRTLCWKSPLFFPGSGDTSLDAAAHFVLASRVPEPPAQTAPQAKRARLQWHLTEQGRVLCRGFVRYLKLASIG